MAHASRDPFAKVRSIGGTLIVLLGLRASMRVISYVVHTVTSPGGGVLTDEQLASMRGVEMGLLGLENLVTIVAMITFLVWIHRVFTAIRDGGGRTSWSPSMAVGGWFIPLVNVVMPWLTVRDALKSLGRPTALAGAWWIAWLLAMPLVMLHTLVRELFIFPELASALAGLPGTALGDLYQLSNSTFWPYAALDTGAWALLLAIVATVRKAR